MPRVLLFSNTTGYQANAFKEAAERLGISIALATDRCHVLEDPWQDGAIPMRFEEPQDSAEKIADFAKRHPIAGIVAIGDAPTMTAAFAAERLGLPYHPPHAVDACRNKWISRERFKAAGLAVPWYRRFPTDYDASMAAGEVPFPCVLKPLGLSASRGVIRANDKQEFVAAFDRITKLLEAAAIRISRLDSIQWIQVESYIPGQEFALEGLVTNGQLKTLALFDKPDPLEGPFFEETIYVTPSRATCARSTGNLRLCAVCRNCPWTPARSHPRRISLQRTGPMGARSSGAANRWPMREGVALRREHASGRINRASRSPREHRGN